MAGFSEQRLSLQSSADLEVYQNLFDSMPCLVSVQDRAFRLIKVNRNFQEEFGHRLGEYCFEVYKGRDGVCPGCSVERTFQDGRPHSSEEKVIKQDGQEATILVTTSPVFDAEHSVVAAIEMSLDVTGVRRLEAELKTSEDRYQVLFNNQPNAIFLVRTDDLTIVDANDTALIDYGFSRSELREIGVLGLALDDEQGRVRGAIRRKEREIFKVPHRRKGGDVLVTDMRISYPINVTEDLAIVTVTDITDRLKTEEQLAQASKLATLGEMSAGVAHELNQPLSVIKSASTFLSFLAKKVIEKNGPASPEGPQPAVSIQADVLRSLADEIDSHVDRASRIIQHLREFGRRSDLTPTEVDVNLCVREVFMMLGRQLEGRGIQAQLRLEDPLPPIMADKNRVEQVFINLILNARDACEQQLKTEGGKGLEMALCVRSFFEDDAVKISFRDTGCGIPEDIQPRIFDPFFTTKEVGKGTGLGLSISYGIVQDYGGRILVESAVGKGTTFTVSFPVRDGAAG